MDPHAIFENYKRILTQHYFDMSGRVGRAEFWYFVLANFIAFLAAKIAGTILHMPLETLYNLAVLLPATSLGARRLQDIGRNGQLVWVLFFLMALTLLPMLWLIWVASILMALLLIYFWCQVGDPGDNMYGPPPPVFDPRRPVAPPA